MASGNDTNSHTETYSGFTSAVKWAALAVAIATAVVIAIVA